MQNNTVITRFHASGYEQPYIGTLAVYSLPSVVAETANASPIEYVKRSQSSTVLDVTQLAHYPASYR
jgi:hypothetical protein